MLTFVIHLRELLAVRRGGVVRTPIMHLRPVETYFCEGLSCVISCHCTELRAGEPARRSDASPIFYSPFQDLVFVMVADRHQPRGIQLFLISSFNRDAGRSCGSVVHLPRLSLRA